MVSFLGHPVCHLGLIWCILLGVFLCFATKPLGLVTTGLFWPGFLDVLLSFKMHDSKMFALLDILYFNLSGSNLTFKLYKQRLQSFCFQNNVFSYKSVYLLLLVTFYKVYRPIWHRHLGIGLVLLL